MAAPVVVILAAGKGTRMRSRIPKLLHPLCGRPMIDWPVAAAREAGAAKVVVVDSPDEPLREHLGDSVELVVQREALGTADAVRAASAHLDTDAPVVVIAGDVPLITAETIAALSRSHEESGAGATVMTAVVEDPAGYGRIVRAVDGSVARIVETKTPGDASDAELRIDEINTAVYAFNGRALLNALERVGNHNAQGEYYLPDVVPAMSELGHRTAAFELSDPEETAGVNDRRQLAQVSRIAQRRINERHMLAGATIIAPEHTVIDVDVTLGEDVLIEPGTALHGSTRVGDGSTVGPHSTLIDTEVGSRSRVLHSYATGAQIGDGVSVGPFAYLRPGTVLHEGSKAGTFVELKNTQVGARSKVPHLSYVGDATIGEDSNLGASTITANYDGYAKHPTRIGSRVRTAVDTTLVAPVELGDDAVIGGGSVITKDVPAGSLGIARARQTNIDGYAERSRQQREAERATPEPGRAADESGQTDDASEKGSR